ncbi:MAG: DNA-protecting protein DprA [Bacteroidota bacterium]
MQAWGQLVLPAMNDAELLQHLSLTMIPQVGDVQIGILLKHFGSAASVLSASAKALEEVPGIGTVRAASIKNCHVQQRVEAEWRFIQKNHIKVLVKGNQGYPSKLEHCMDAPHVLYYKGSSDLLNKRVVSVVGTRSPSQYGKDRVVELMAVLGQYNVMVVSGLAYGIDTVAHKEALNNTLETIGVLGHGHDQLYPHANKALAADMLQQGGLLSEFMQGIQPEKQNFPKRNRIVAGMADAVVVVESGSKGGSLITADIANSYNKDVLAYPGRATDPSSKGCNQLIRNHKANLITCGQDLVEFMNWAEDQHQSSKVQHAMKASLSDEENVILSIISHHDPCPIDLLTNLSGLNPGLVSAHVLSLEMAGLITSLPGKLYGFCQP